MANYTVNRNWQSLSTILGANYDSGKIYRIHNNAPTTNYRYLAYTEVQNPDNTVQGSVAHPLADVYIDAGLDVSLRNTAPEGELIIDITEVEE